VKDIVLIGGAILLRGHLANFGGAGAGMSGGPDLVSLLYHVDWTQLSLSAVANDGTRVLVAPGRRYRVEAGDYLTGCDGDRRWRLDAEEAQDAGGDVHWVSGPEPPLAELLCPAWLLISSQLEVRGAARACGRDAFRVEVTRRAGLNRRHVPPQFRAAHAEVMVDAVLGILLRVAWLADGAEPEVTELASLDLDPVIDPALFMPPPGSLIAESTAEALGAGGAGWTALKTVAGLAAGGLGAWIRYVPPTQKRTAEQAGDADAAISPDGPPPERSPGGRPVGPPVSAQVLHDSTASEFTATVHEWTDFGAMLSQVPPGARRAGFGGLGLLMDSISERPATTHLISSLRMAGPGRYRIDYANEERRGPVMVACDGQRCWQVYRDRVTAGPAAPPPSGVAEMLDPSWLLGCRLSGGASVLAGDRQAYRINVARGEAGWPLSWPLIFPAAVAVADAGTGIVLRLTSYIGDQPVRRCELRDITATAGDFTIDIPPGLPVVEETGPSGDEHHRGGPHRVGVPLKAVGAAAGQVATGVAKDAAKAAGNLLRRISER
jgi:hypothetical protein